MDSHSGRFFFCGEYRGFFFFKQKTAYEIRPSLVGSEMCIRERILIALLIANALTQPPYSTPLLKGVTQGS